MKGKIICAIFAITLLSAVTRAMEDTPSNRSMLADQLISRAGIQEGIHQTIEHMAQVIPTEQKKNFKEQMMMSIDISALERAMREGMIKRFTADELQAFADSSASSVGGSLEERQKAYTLEVMRAFGQLLDAALAKVTPELARWILNDGRLGLRVKKLYSAIANKEMSTRYEMESVAVRRSMTFEAWKKDAGLDKPQRQSTVRTVQGELEEVLDCTPWAYDDDQQTLRCRIFVRVTVEDDGGHRKQHRLLEMWESVDGGWYHGFTDHHGWEDRPK